MPKKLSKYDPINRKERDLREDLIHKPDVGPAIKKMHNNFVKGIDILKEAIAEGTPKEDLAKLRKKLGADGWSLQNLYGYDLKQYNLNKLGVKLNVGTVLSNNRK